jgi:hypothetical protein
MQQRLHKCGPSFRFMMREILQRLCVERGQQRICGVSAPTRGQQRICGVSAPTINQIQKNNKLLAIFYGEL